MNAQALVAKPWPLLSFSFKSDHLVSRIIYMYSMIPHLVVKVTGYILMAQYITLSLLK